MDPLSLASRLSASALRAQSIRTRVIAENLANAESTGTTSADDPYMRKIASFDRTKSRDGSFLVTVKSIDGDSRPFRMELRPGHPAADAKGFVKFPNVDPLIEIADMKDANRAYQANLQSIRQVRELIAMTLELLKA